MGDAMKTFNDLNVFLNKISDYMTDFEALDTYKCDTPTDKLNCILVATADLKPTLLGNRRRIVTDFDAEIREKENPTHAFETAETFETFLLLGGILMFVMYVIMKLRGFRKTRLGGELL